MRSVHAARTPAGARGPRRAPHGFAKGVFRMAREEYTAVIEAAGARLREAVDKGEPIAALTGAGVSAESGIPTFRGAGGFWEGFRAEDLATPEACRDNPEKVWEWYHWRRRFVLDASPNPAHRALAALERVHPRFTLITQNVDGLHQRAGSQRVVELHGSLHQMRCLDCGLVAPVPGDAEGVMRCAACGGVCRPHIVWFGELLPEEEWRRAYAAALGARVMLVAGTSAAVYPAAGLVEVAADRGADVIEVNPEETALSWRATWAIREPAGAAVPKLLAAARIDPHGGEPGPEE